MSAWRTWTALSWAAVLLAAGCASAGSSGGATSASAAASTSGSAGGEALWLQALQMSTPSTGWALYFAGNPSTVSAGTPTLLARTTDGARSWADVTPHAAAAMLSTSNANEVLDAVSAGRAYLAVTASTQESPTSVSTTVVFTTADGGRTWTESAPVRNVGYVSELSFMDPSHGWLLWSEGAAGGQNPVRVYRTTDGGRHWTLTAQSPSFASNSTAGIPKECDKTGIAFASATAGWLTGACAAGVQLLTSRDGGVTWAPQQLPPSACAGVDTFCEVTGPRFTGGTGFLTVGASEGMPALLATRDLGQTWQPVSLPAGYSAGTYPYPQVTFFGPRYGVLVPGGSQGSLGDVFYTTADGGQSWTAIPQGVRFTHNGVAVDFVSANVGFAWILGGDAQGAMPPAAYETMNSGRTWTSLRPRLAG